MMLPNKRPNSFIGDMYLAWAEGNTVPLDLAAPWYRAGGAPAPIAVWEAKGADDLASSYVNLINPGTYDITKGGVGTIGWDAINGWEGAAAANAYLSTGIAMQQTYTVLVRYSGLSDVLAEGICGCNDATNGIHIYCAGSGTIYFRNGETSHAQYIASYVGSGVVGLAGKIPYIDGAAQTAIAAGGSDPSASYDLRLLGINNSGSGLYNAETTDYYQAAVVYDTTLTASQMLAVSNAMAAL